MAQLIVRNLDDAKAILKTIGLPAIIRPSFTLAGTGGGIAFNREEFEELAKHGLDLSPVDECNLILDGFEIGDVDPLVSKLLLEVSPERANDLEKQHDAAPLSQLCSRRILKKLKDALDHGLQLASWVRIYRLSNATAAHFCTFKP